MANFPYIPEEAFADYEGRLLLELARAIAFSGYTLSELARAARIKWDTIYNASQGRPVRFCNYARIRCVLINLQQEEAEVKSNKGDSI